jgi:hypothetical protein
MLAPAARRDERRVLDLQRRQLETDEHVRVRLKHPSERRELDRFLPERAVGEK